jgi:hypothetical protein
MSRIRASTGSTAGGSGTGDVVGIPPTTINAIATWANGSATLIQDSLATVLASGDVHAQGFVTNRIVNGTITVGATETWIAPALQLEPGANIIIQPGGELLLI